MLSPEEDIPYTAMRDAIFTHLTMAEGLLALFANVPPVSASVSKVRVPVHEPQ